RGRCRDEGEGLQSQTLYQRRRDRDPRTGARRRAATNRHVMASELLSTSAINRAGMIPMLFRIPSILFALVIFAVSSAHANDAYPGGPVRLIVPFAPGGLVDVMGRLLGQKLGEHLGQNFVIENRAGGGGNTGVALAQAAAPDGYTILFTSSTFLVNPALQKV